MTTIGSLFTGYGGLDMGVAMAVDPTARVAWTSDVEPGPCKLAQVRWPDTPNLGDITQINWETVEPVDIICGGSPCQDLSLAGKRAGMATGTRSGLWESMATAIETIRPRLVVWENVQGALSARAYSPVESEPTMLGTRTTRPALRAAGRVAGDLADLGYDCRWAVIRASDAGAPHQRARFFLIGHPHGQPWHMRRPSAPEQTPGRRPHRQPTGPSLGTLMPTPTASDHKAGRHQDGTGHSLTQAVQLLPTPVAQPSGNSPTEHLRKKPGRDRVTDLAIIVENNLLPTGGLLPTPQATYAPRSSPGYGPNLHEVVRDLLQNASKLEATALLPTPKAVDGVMGLPRTSGRPPEKSTHLATRLEYTDYGDYAPAIARWEHVTGRAAPPPTTPSRRAGGKPRLSARFVEWMMGLPIGYVGHPDIQLDRDDRMDLLYSGTVPLQAAHAVAVGLTQMGDQ